MRYLILSLLFLSLIGWSCQSAQNENSSNSSVDLPETEVPAEKEEQATEKEEVVEVKKEEERVDKPNTSSDDKAAGVQEDDAPKSEIQVQAAPKAATTSRGNQIQGKFVYFADAALFFTCEGNRKYAVAQKEAYLDLEKLYLSLEGRQDAEQV
ncbi:MAG: hypothetical protein AAFP19_25360, partial [Bacteroidota bacterium]